MNNLAPRYWQLDPNKLKSKKGQHPKDTWDMAVYEASEEYKGRMVKSFMKLLSLVVLFYTVAFSE